MRETRHQKILDYLFSHQSADIDELSQYCDVSTATIRRDLDYLEINGDLLRVHGGAMRKSEKIDSFLLARSLVQADAKKRIGKAAADLVQDHDTIIVSTGTPTEAMIPFLSEKKDLTVITNALNVAYQLTKYENITTIAIQTGFNDSNYFSRQFRKVTGLSPRAFRQKNRSGPIPPEANRTGHYFQTPPKQS